MNIIITLYIIKYLSIFDKNKQQVYIMNSNPRELKKKKKKIIKFCGLM